MATKAEETVVDMKNPPNNLQLEDDKPPQEGEFVGATLEISGTAETEKGVDPDVEFRGPGLTRDRPGSTIGRQSVRSTTSRTSMRAGLTKTNQQADKYFSYKETAIDKAVESCMKEKYKADLDGDLTGHWLLTQIDHWDNEREKLVLLTENSVLVYRYNFINSKVEEFKRISLHIIDTIRLGDFKYPEYSVMPIVSNGREHGGIQLNWSRGEIPSFGQRWNPWCQSIPWITFSHHPLIYNPKENETVTFNCDEFYESLVQAVSKVYNRKRPGEKVTVMEGPIEIQSYANFASMIFNQSSLGFCQDRNGVSF